MKDNSIAPQGAEALAIVLSLYDEDFVRAAYQVILGREPDRIGFEHYVSQVRKGTSKRRIVVELALSPEGKKCPDVPGLHELVAQYTRRLPYVVVRLLRRIKGDSPETTKRQLRILENRLYTVEKAIVGQSTLLSEALAILKQNRQQAPVAPDAQVGTNSVQSFSLPPHTPRVAHLYSELKAAIALKIRKAE